MTEIPEHLRKRAEAAKAKARDPVFFHNAPRHTPRRPSHRPRALDVRLSPHFSPLF